jgi:adenylate cyclase
MKKTHIYRILFLVSFWVFAAAFKVSYESSTTVFELRSTYNMETISYDFPTILLTAVLVTLAGSIPIGTFEVLYFNKLLRKKPFGVTLFVKTAFYLANIFFFNSIGTILLISQRIGTSVADSRVIEKYAEWLASPRVLMDMAFWGLAVLFALFILQVSDKFGQGVLVNFLTSSTTYAEKLGHIKYSQLLQDCFYDLTDIVVKHDAQVYQYVGDEVVLTWESRKGVKDNRCVSTFFEYDSVIRERSDHYQEKYGVIPEFKAGLNLGYVTVAEVGEIKKELAYHGDALNTAARIRSVCSEVGKRLLIAAELLSVLPEIDREFSVESMGMSRLKGKKNVVGLFSIEQKDNLQHA